MLNQQLYDMLGGAILYILRYAEKNKIDLPNRDELRRMSDNIHDLTYRINELSDEGLQPSESAKDFTEPLTHFCRIFG